MPELPSHAKPARMLVCLLALLAGPLAWGQAEPEPQEVHNSGLDAPLFYQLLVGELELQSGEAGTAYQLMLDAARKEQSEPLFRRATEIALQARAGEQALTAVQAWRRALPTSLQAAQFEVQLLVALNRIGQLEEPLQAMLKRTPTPQMPGVISSLPRLLARSSDRSLAARVLEQALGPWLGLPETGTAAKVALGRARLAAGDPKRALELAQAAQAEDPGSDAPALLALELLPKLPQAEALVNERLQAAPGSTSLRLAYVQALTAAQRYGDAVAQVQQVTRDEPERASAWLSLGALQLELRHPAEAEAALQRYLALAQAADRAPAAAPEGHPGLGDMEVVIGDNGEDAAYLMLAQVAEMRRDYPAAQAWLDKVDSPERALEVQSRRASLLARQGRIDEARHLIQQAPAADEADERAKRVAEAQILREAGRWADARSVLEQANGRFPNDVGLLYEQAMVDEKLDRLDEMERLLRRVIELKPDHQHAYNALGYSLAERNLRLPEARKLIRKALDLAPGDPFITDSLGWVSYRQGRIDEAVQLLRQAYRSRPDPEIAAHLGEVLWVAGQHEEARRIWREGRNRDADNAVLRETLARLRVDL